MNTPLLICLCGTTASNKSDLALALCERFPCEIVSVDSSQVYLGMDIGSNKPSRAVQRRVKHHLIDIQDPKDPYSAADFVRDANRAIKDICSRGRVPLLVGGTMFYFKALLWGLDPLPAADAELRRQLLEAHQQNPPGHLHNRLKALDAEAATSIHPNNVQRLLRALEIRLTQQPVRDEALHKNSPRAIADGLSDLTLQDRNFRLLQLAITRPSRTELGKHIERRFDNMLANGLVNEVRQLRQRKDLDLTLPSMRAIAYRQIWEFLDGKYDESEMKKRTVTATKQFAKRQMTWLRSWPNLFWLQPAVPQHSEAKPASLEQLVTLCAEKLQRLGLTQ